MWLRKAIKKIYHVVMKSSVRAKIISSQSTTKIKVAKQQITPTVSDSQDQSNHYGLFISLASNPNVLE
jgi:hypothetical protein